MVQPEVLRYYQEMPARVRLHVHGRWRLFPFPELEGYLPEGRNYLDLGCGYGLWPLYLARRHPQAMIWGFDPDAAKVEAACTVALGQSIKNVHFGVGKAEEVSLPPCDAVTLIDVMYLIPYTEQEKILSRVASRLDAGGALLIKEMSQTPWWKYAWNMVEELLAVRALRITYGEHFYFRPEAEWRQLLESLGLRVRAIRLDAGYLRPHILFIGEKV